MSNRKILAGFAAAALLALAACSTQKGPATEAVNAAQAALANVSAEAARYLPSDLEGVQASFNALRGQLEAKDYKSVLANAPALLTSINSLQDAVTARKAAVEAATVEWGALSTDLPRMVTAIQDRLDSLAKSRRLPRNLTQASYDAAKSGFDSLKATWDAATTAAAAGDPVDAVAKGREVQARGNEILTLLGMSG